MRLYGKRCSRLAAREEAEEACHVVRRSIAELCHLDHNGDAQTIGLWVANKTAENMRRWISEHHVFVAAEGTSLLGVAVLTSSAEIILNYVSPEARFRGVSKALVTRLEAQASELAAEIIVLQSTATARPFYLSLGYEENGAPTSSFSGTLGHPMVKRLR